MNDDFKKLMEIEERRRLRELGMDLPTANDYDNTSFGYVKIVILAIIVIAGLAHFLSPEGESPVTLLFEDEIRVAKGITIEANEVMNRINNPVAWEDEGFVITPQYDYKVSGRILTTVEDGPLDVLDVPFLSKSIVLVSGKLSNQMTIDKIDASFIGGRIRFPAFITNSDIINNYRYIFLLSKDSSKISTIKDGQFVELSGKLVSVTGFSGTGSNVKLLWVSKITDLTNQYKHK